MYTIPKNPPDLDELRRKVPGTALVGDRVLELCAASDVVFLALHAAFKTALDEMLAEQNQIYTQMSAKDWYPAEAAEQQKITEAKQKFANVN